jgi:signal peptidase II
MAKKLALVLPIAIIGIVLDLVTKYFAYTQLRPTAPIELIPDYFSLFYAQNTGMAFSVGKGMSVLVFLALRAIALGVLFYFIRRVPVVFTLTLIALALILAGAVGNMVDRLTLGFVIDFIDWHVGPHHWPTFNMADVYITLGVTALVAQMLFSSKDPFALKATGENAGLASVKKTRR